MESEPNQTNSEAQDDDVIKTFIKEVYKMTSKDLEVL